MQSSHNKKQKTPPNHAYTLPEVVPGEEAGFEELFGLIDRSIQSRQTWVLILVLLITHLYFYLDYLRRLLLPESKDYVLHQFYTILKHHFFKCSP